MANNMSHKLSHTMIRGRTYYTNFRINGSSSFIRISLGTDSLKQASLIMSRVYPFIPLVQNGTMGLDEFKLKLQGYRAATKQDFDNYLLRALHMDINEVKRLPQLGHHHKDMFPDTPLSPSATVEVAKRYADTYLNRMYNGDEMGAKEVLLGLQSDDLLEQRKSGIQTGKLMFSGEVIPWAKEAAGEIDMNRATVYQAYTAFYSGDLPRYRQLLETLQSQFKAAEHKVSPLAKSSPTVVSTNSSEPGKTAISLSKAWEGYVKDKGSHWQKSTANENQRFFDVLFHVVGDVPVDKITKQNIYQSLGLTKNMPVRTKLPYARMSLEECIEYDVPEEDLISSEHVYKHLKLWRALFKTYLVDRQEALVKAPTDGVAYEITPNRGGSYNLSELRRLKNKLISYPDCDYRKWYFLTLIYTGARRSEIASLQKKHLKKDEDSGRYYFFIETGKTKHARRKVPLHKSIVSNLLAKVEQINDNQPIFGNMPNYTTITNEWSDIMKELAIPDLDESGLKRRVHALRHSFISRALATTGNFALVQHIVGHSRTKTLSITDRYLHPTVGDLAVVVDCIE